MSYSNKDKKIAINKCFELNLDIRKTISKLKYPSYSALYSWISVDKRFNSLIKQKYNAKYSNNTKEKAVDLISNGNYSQIDIAKQLSIKTPASISKWKRDFNIKGKMSIMSKRKSKDIDFSISPEKIDLSNKSIDEIKKLFRKQELELDAYKKVAELFSKKA
jgi:transposase-like protein